MRKHYITDEIIEEIIKEFVILVDTSSLMSEGAETFFYDTLSLKLLKHNKKVIIPKVVIRELENNIMNKDIKKSILAKKGYKILKYMEKENLIDIRGEKTDKHPDQVFRRVYTQHGLLKNIAFITNDNYLSEELCQLRNSKSVKTNFKLKVIAIDENGKVKITCDNGIFFKSNKKKSIDIDFNDTDISDLGKEIKLSKIPSEGDYVRTYSGYEVFLDKEIASGGEGKIFLTNFNESMCVKIYTSEKLTYELKYKIKKMSEVSVKTKKNKFKIAWPIEPVKNENGEFCGFLMERIEGKTLYEVCFTPAYAKRLNLRRSNLVEISINLLDAFIYLHLKNIIIGDINPRNILININNNFSIGLIDTDSYQIGNFSCRVGTLEFTRPSLLRKSVNYNYYKRTPMDELFSISVIIFRILMLGKHPYSHAGGEDIIQNMKNGRFPYRISSLETEYENTPVGPWKFIWSHIPMKVKENLGKVLIEDNSIQIKNFGDLINYEKNIKTSLEQYLSLINLGVFTDELMPRAYNVPDKIEGREVRRVPVKCSKCGYEFFMSEDYYEKIKDRREILCGICLESQTLIQNLQNN